MAVDAVFLSPAADSLGSGVVLRTGRSTAPSDVVCDVVRLSAFRGEKESQQFSAALFSPDLRQSRRSNWHRASSASVKSDIKSPHRRFMPLLLPRADKKSIRLLPTLVHDLLNERCIIVTVRDRWGRDLLGRVGTFSGTIT